MLEMRISRLIKRLLPLGLTPINRSFSDGFNRATDDTVHLLEQVQFNQLKGKVFYYKMVPVNREEAQMLCRLGNTLVVQPFSEFDSRNLYRDEEEIRRSAATDEDDYDDIEDAFSFANSLGKSKSKEAKKTQENESTESFEQKAFSDTENADQFEIEQEFGKGVFFDSSGEMHAEWEKDSDNVLDKSNGHNGFHSDHSDSSVIDKKSQFFDIDFDRIGSDHYDGGDGGDDYDN